MRERVRGQRVRWFSGATLRNFFFSCGFGCWPRRGGDGLAVCGVAIPFLSSGAGPPIRAVNPDWAVWRSCHGQAFRGGGFGRRVGGLPCGIRQGQKRAAFGIGWRGDTSPLKGCCAVTFGYRRRTF
jgi:hypothetical protein